MKRSTVNILASYIEALHPIIYINHFDFKVIDNYLMVKMPKEVDHHNSGYISKTADKFIMKDGIGNVVFDFEDTKFMDSSGIGIIIGRYKKISYFGGKVFAVNADTRIKRTLMICGLHKVIEIME